MKIDYWINNFKSFNSKQQLKIAEVIKNELETDELFKDENEYDVSKSEQIRSFFRTLLETTIKKEDVEKNKDILKRFEKLSLNYRIDALYKIIEIIESSYKKQEQEMGANICQKEGHIFSDWEYHSYTTHGLVMYPDHQVGEGLIEHTFWRRVCNRCGYKEEELFEPEEARVKREEKEKQERAKYEEQKKNARIKELKKELKVLESNK